MNISISLTPELVGLIKAKVASGRYTSTSEVREALCLLERADERDVGVFARLRDAWTAGMTSADAGPLDFADLKAEAKDRLATVRA